MMKSSLNPSDWSEDWPLAIRQPVVSVQSAYVGAGTASETPGRSLPGELRPVPALDDSTMQALRELLSEGESHNTVRSYQSAMRYWMAWHFLRYGCEMQMPLPVAVVLQFVADHAQRSTPQGMRCEMPPALDEALVQAGVKTRCGAPAHSTLTHRLAVLSRMHQVRGLPNPCQDASVRQVMSRTRRAYARRGELARKKEAITKDVLQRLLDTCDDSLRGKRDRALLLFAWSSGGRRRSEVTGADMRYLRQLGPQEFVYELVHSKANQDGAARPDNIKPVLGAAARALTDWLQASGVREGAIFRRVRRGGNVGEALTPAAVRSIVRERCELAAVQGDFSAHSLRSGFVTEAGRRNVPLAQTMAMTGHQSVTTVLGYFRAEAVAHNQAARLMDED